jgi:16S rRNA (guanine(966)-N(2))-methyltransferase RsmD
MRVISGSARGRKLKSPGEATRPITDRVKENLFNILAARLLDANVLDLFAGVGSVGIEALSRGARAATFVEIDHAALRALEKNLELTGVRDRATVVRLDVFKYIRRQTPEQFDLIYVAPPQYKGLWEETVLKLDKRGLVAPEGTVVAQIHPKEYHPLELECLELTDQRKYGSTLLAFYRPRRTP